MWRETVERAVGELEHPAWGPEHSRRLYALCRQIAEQERLDLDDDVLFAIAWLHDIGTFPAYACEDAPPLCAARAAEQLLVPTDFPREKLPVVMRIIREHSFDERERESMEARVLRDADMLEFIGPVGIVRLLSAAHREDWIGDRSAAVAIAYDFCQRLPSQLYTGAGRRLARERAIIGLAFIERLATDAGGLDQL